jgi:hypothetical protein
MSRLDRHYAFVLNACPAGRSGRIFLERRMRLKVNEFKPDLAASLAPTSLHTAVP